MGRRSIAARSRRRCGVVEEPLVSEHGQRSSPWWRLGLPAIGASICLIIAFSSRIGRDLWLDEAFTVTSTNQLWMSLRQRSGSMGLYYVFMSLWTKVSLDQVWLRIPSAVFTAGAVAASARFALVHFGRRVAAWSTTWLVLMVGTIAWAQEARSYSLVMLLGVLSWSLLFRVIRDSTRAGWTLWAVCCAAMIYSHPFAAFVVIAQFISLRAAPEPPPRRFWLLGTGVLAVLMIPMALSLLQEVSPHPHWVPPLGWQALEGSLTIVSGPHRWAQAVWLTAIVASVVVVAVKRSSDSDSTWKAQSMLAWALTTPIILVLLSLAEPMFVERYLVPLLPALAITVAIALTQTKVPSVIAAAGAVLVVALVSGQIALRASAGDAWSDATTIVIDDATAGDIRTGVLFPVPETRQPFEVNAHARLDQLDRVIPVAPAEEWGTNLRYPAEVSETEINSRLVGLDVLWEVQQIFSDQAAEPDSRYQEHGFCFEEVVALPPRLELHRFVRCTPTNP